VRRFVNNAAYRLVLGFAFSVTGWGAMPFVASAFAAQNTNIPSNKGDPSTSHDETQVEIELKKISISSSWKLEPGSNDSIVPSRAEIELPVLDVNSQYEIDLTLRNPNSYPISFSEARLSCSCSSAKFSTKTFLPNESAQVKVNLKTPKSNLENEIRFAITLYSDFECENFAGSILVVGKLQGNLNIDKRQRIFQLSENNSVVKIPMAFSYPVSLDRLTVKPSEDFRDCSIKIVADANDRHFLIMDIPASKLAQGTLVGHVKILDRELKLEDIVEIICEAQNPVVISPTNMQFRNQEGKQGLQLTNFLIRIDEDPVDVNSRFQSEVKIRCSLQGKTLDLKIQKLSESVFRGTLFLPKDFTQPTSNEQGDLNWEIMTGSKTYRLSTEFSCEE
jgi:hypothetical protein